MVSDRRWRKVVKLLQVSALTNGRSKASIWDAWLVQHCVWSAPADREKVFDWYAARVGATRSGEPSALTRLVVALESRLERDRAARSQLIDDQGRRLFRHPDGSVQPDDSASTQAKRGDAHLFLAPVRASTNSDYDYEQYHIKDRSNGGKGFTKAELDEVWVNTVVGNYRNTQFKAWAERSQYLGDSNNWLLLTIAAQPAMEPTRYDPAQIAARLGDVDALAVRISEHVRHLEAQIAGLEREITSHLWVLPDFAAPASRSLDSMLHDTRALETRVNSVRAGIRSLPVVDCDPGAVNARG
jgi:MoxR-like ATPase